MTSLLGRAEQLLSWFDRTCNRQVKKEKTTLPVEKNAADFGEKEENIIF